MIDRDRPLTGRNFRTGRALEPLRIQVLVQLLTPFVRARRTLPFHLKSDKDTNSYVIIEVFFAYYAQHARLWILCDNRIDAVDHVKVRATSSKQLPAQSISLWPSLLRRVKHTTNPNGKLLLTRKVYNRSCKPSSDLEFPVPTWTHTRWLACLSPPPTISLSKISLSIA